jgi:hypothetical protein
VVLCQLLDWTGAPLRTFSQHTSSVWGLHVDDSNANLVASSSFCVVSLADVRSPRAPWVFRAHGTWVRALQMDLDR